MMKIGIRARLSISTIAAVVIITAIIVGYFSIHNRTTDKENTFDLIDNTCRRISSDVTSRLNIDLGKVQALASMYNAQQSLTDEQLDAKIFPVLKNNMQDPRYLAFWVSYEMSAIHPEYANKSGRKSWIVDRLKGDLEERYEYHGMMGKDETPQYLSIKEEKKEILIDPYWYKPGTSGNRADSIMESSIVVPLISNGTVVGLAGIDFRLNDFDAIIDQKMSGHTYKIILISNDGTLVASSGEEAIGKKVKDLQLFDHRSPAVLESIAKGTAYSTIASFQDGAKYYCSLYPVKIGSSEKGWSICILSPISEILRNANSIFGISLIIGLIGMIFMGLVVYFISFPIVKPITQTTQALDALAQGQIKGLIKLKTHDDHELGIMAGSVNRIQERFLAIAEFAANIGMGKLNSVYPYDTQNDMLGQALVQMQSDLIKLQDNTDKIVWSKTGIAGLNDAFRKASNLDDLAKVSIQYVAKFLKAPIGALYYTDESHRMLHLGAGYAFSKRKELNQHIPYGEGLVGQCASEREPITLTRIPEDYFPIKSATGSIAPSEVLVVPCVYNSNLQAVIELGTLTSFSSDELDLLKNFSDNIAITIQTVKAKDEMSKLLAKTLEQKEELQAQEEELREANQTLEKQTEELRRSESNLQAQQEELRVTNQELEKTAQLLEEQSEKIAEKNRALQIASGEIEQKAKDLEQASRYKSEFLANMSHELRTPLNSMLILSQSLSENTSGHLSPDEVESAQIIFKSGNDLHNLINEILDLSKIEAGKMTINIEKVETQQMADNISSLYQAAAADKGLYLDVTVEKTCPLTLFTDQQRTEQIIKNLVSNALKFTSQGGISVKFDRAPKELIYKDPSLKDKDNLAISVIDTGIGIAAEKQQAIFEAFQQADGSTSRKYGGTGLGLSISKELAKMLGGEMHLSSTPGQGSVFTLIIPGDTATDLSHQTESPTASKPEPVLVQQQEFSAPVSAISHSAERVPAPFIHDDREKITSDVETILVIEDDPEFAKILYKECHKQHFTCMVAGDGESGLALAHQFIPAAIILDIKLPGMDGWKVLDLIKKDSKIRHIPVHMMSSMDETIEAFQKGAIGYLKKPVTAQSLAGAFEKIENFLKKKMKHLLIVEDNELLRKTMHQLLKGADIEIDEVSTAHDCIASLSNHTYDCLILDLGLPDKNGLDLIKDIREMHLEQLPPIIVYTGQELSREQNDELHKYTKSIIIKGVKSEERLLDEATLFLHRVVQDLPQQQQTILRKLYEKEDVLEGKTVLLVDDDMRNIFALSKIFEDKGIKVLKAENGLRALDAIRSHNNINAILMDIMMPEMDGYEAIKEIRKENQYKETPIIALTAKAMKEDRQKCLDAGASDYISKPIDISKLLSLLRVWLKK